MGAPIGTPGPAVLYSPDDTPPDASDPRIVSCPSCGHQLGFKTDDGTVESSVRTKHFGHRTVWDPARIRCEVCGGEYRRQEVA